MKKFFWILVSIGALALFAPLFKESKIPETLFLDSFLDPKRPEMQFRTGDLLLWSTTSMKSILIQEMTDGAYSHCALLYRDSKNQIWALDTYPLKGLRFMPVDQYLNTTKSPVTRIGIIRYRGTLNITLMEQLIKNLLNHKDQIRFDDAMIYDSLDLDFAPLNEGSYSLYCAELIFKIFEDCTSNSNLYDNDYDRVMAKWDIFSKKTEGGVPVIDSLKRFYLKKYLRKLKENPHKVLISPNGFMRSGAFKIIQEVKGPVEPGTVKKYVGKMPKIQDTLAKSNIQR